MNEYKFSSPESCVRVSFDAETSRWVVVVMSNVIVAKTYLFYVRVTFIAKVGVTGSVKRLVHS